MQNLFYIIQCTSKNELIDWWQLRLQTTQDVISCGSTKEKILECLYNIVKKYKTEARFLKVLSKREYSKGVCKTEFEIRQKEFKRLGHLYIDEINEIIIKAEQDLLKEKATKSTLGSSIKIVKRNIPKVEVKPIVEEIPQLKNIGKPLLSKIKVLM